MQSVTDLQTKYEANLPLYEKGLEDISNIAGAFSGKHIHSIKYRIKTFESFYNKITRKQYDKPFEQCTDIVGFRIVCLFTDAIPEIIAAIKKKCTVIEEIELKRKEDTFSYQSTHIIVLHTVSGKKIRAEFQIRTILQEAWAEMEHYVNYKKIGIDKEVLRKINALSALLEIADDQFSSIHKEFKTTKTAPSLLRQTKLSPERIYHYCKATFPNVFKNSSLFDNVDNVKTYEKIFAACTKKGILTVKQLDAIYKNHEKDLLQYDARKVAEILNNKTQWPRLYERCKKTKQFFTPAVLLSVMIEELYRQ
jgi:ppGpp synthetase/RelA/SpoT-type nucleotidyltranferase